MKDILAASLSAIAVQPIVFLLWIALPPFIAGADVPLADIASASLLAAIVAVPFVLLIGIPSALLLRRFGRLRWFPFATIGFVAAALPVAANLPGGDSRFSSGGNFYGHVVDYVVAGEPTIWGWLNYAQSVLFFGLHGLIGASVFYLVWRRSMGPNNSFKPNLLRSTKHMAG